MRRSLCVAATIVVMAVVAACGAPAAAPTPAASAAPGASSAPPLFSGATVIILDSKFDPPVVNARVGAPVTWRNTDATQHSVTWDDGTQPSGSLGQGGTYSRTFDRAGRFDYVCGIHSGMTGAVSVE